MSHGSCLCGEVKYSFTGSPAAQALCHCVICHKVSGSTFTTNLLIPFSAFTISSGSDKLKTYALTHPNGMKMSYKFCGDCGTKIYKEGDAEEFKGLFILQAGTLDEGGLGEVKVGAELWVKERVGWLGELGGGVAQCQEFQ